MVPEFYYFKTASKNSAYEQKRIKVPSGQDGKKEIGRYGIGHQCAVSGDDFLKALRNMTIPQRIMNQ